MHQWKCVFSVNGTRTETIVSASNSFDARKIVESQYTNCKIQWVNVTRI